MTGHHIYYDNNKRRVIVAPLIIHVLTGINNFRLRSVLHLRAPVGSHQPQTSVYSYRQHQHLCVRCGVCPFSHIFSVFAVWTVLHCSI